MKILLFANTDWYLFNFRISLAEAILKAGHQIVLVSPEGDYGKKLVSKGFDWKPVEMKRRNLNPLTEIKTIVKLTALYRREKPDIVHHFTIKAVIYGMIAAKLSGIKRCINAAAGLGLVFSNNSGVMKFVRLMVLVLLKMLLTGKHTRVIVQNPDDQKLFSSYRLLKDDNIHLIRGSGVNIERFVPRSDKKERANGCVSILLASRMLWDKGVGFFIETARLLQAQAHIRFILAGTPDDGNPNSVSLDDIMNWEKEKNVTYLGHVHDMEQVLSKIDIVTLPTIYGEGVPRILIEAAASGLPIVATNVPGCREIVRHKKNGLLIKPGNIKAYKSAILLLANNPALRKAMGANSRSMVVEEGLDERSVIQKTMNIYSDISSICI